MRLPPPHPFLQQDTADLAAFDADACLFGRLRQRIQAELRRPTLIASHHRPIPLRHQTTRRWLTGQCDDTTAGVRSSAMDKHHGFRIGHGMRRGYRSDVPLPTRLVSNEEFAPLPQT